MAAHRKRAAELGLSAISVEGALIAPAEVVRILSAPADQKTATEYGCPKGTTLKDEIARYFRIGQAHWQGFNRIGHPTIQQVAQFARSQLEEVFGFDQLEGPIERQQDGHRYRLALEAKGGRVPIICAAPIADDDAFRRPLSEFGDGDGGALARRTPAGLLQEWLNANPEFLWGLAFAGDRLRLMRDNLSLTRPAWIEADLGAIYRDENFSEFSALWLLIHATRFGTAGAPAGDSALERWREAGLRAGTAVRERLCDSVEEALELLGQGFLDANPELQQRLASGQLSVTTWFEQLLRLIYRLIFLAVAEDRDLLHAPDARPDAKVLYADNYSFAWLRDRSARQSGRDRHLDAYECTKIVFRALIHGEPLLGLPSLGGLFAPGLTPDIDEAKLENRVFLRALFRLAWLLGPHGRERINWRDMATEELGSVYEGLLELVPIIEGGSCFGFAGGVEAKGNARKASSSYYTPDELVQNLLESALDPVLERAEAEGSDEAILKLRVIDPACGSGHFLLGAARRMANRIATLRAPDAPDYQAAMRDVVRACIFGVDRNPLAVELAKVALWIEAIEPGKPLGFLDANIRCGDSLLGVFDLKALEEGIPDEAYKPLTGDDKPTANGLRKLNKLERESKLLRLAIAPDKLASRFERLHEMPETTLDEVREKERAYRKIHSDPDWWSLRQACDAYVAAFLLPKHKPEESFTAPPVPTTRHVREALDRRPPEGALAAAIMGSAEEARVFHWPVEFADVIIAHGGFDVVLGNPPWDVMQLSDKEFFANTDPEIAALTGAGRKEAIALLAQSNPRLHAAYQIAKRLSGAATEFARTQQRYSLVSSGKINTFSLFAALFMTLIRRPGAAGAILPAEILTSETLSPFFKYITESGTLKAALAFENEEFVFPGIANVVRFCLLTLENHELKRANVKIAHFLRRVSDLEDQRRILSLSPDEFTVFTPTLGTSPIFRSQEDYTMAKRLFSSWPRLGEGRNASWQVNSKQGLFNMTSSSELFRTSKQLEANGNKLNSEMVFKGNNAIYVPLYEGKFISHFDHRFSSYHNLGKIKGRGGRGLPPVTIEEYQDPTFEVLPRYWVNSSDVDTSLLDTGWQCGWFVLWRDISNAKVERTATFSVVPRYGVGDTASLLFPQHSPELTAALLANMNSLVLDYCARQIVGGTHLTFGYLRQLPVLPPGAYADAELAYIVPRVLELSFTSHSMAPFARDLGHDGPPFAWNEGRRAQLRAELDAWYALAYGLSLDELRYILDPKEVMGADYPSETFRVLQNSETNKFGEYRTARLVLAAYDKMIAEGARPRTEGWRQ